MLLAAVAVGAQADNIEWIFTGGTGEWSTASNWDIRVPIAGDTARLISSTDHAEVTTNFNGGNFDILMRNGASLAISADFRTAVNWDLGITGASSVGVTQTAGTVVGRTLNIGGDGETRDFEAKYSVSGGEARFTTAINIRKNGIFEIDGNSVSIENSGAVSMTSGTLSYILATDGVSRMYGNQVDDVFTIGTNSQLAIDASNYTGGEGLIELATFTSIAGTFDTNNISIDGLEEGLSGDITYDSTGELTSMYLNVFSESAIGNMTIAVLPGGTQVELSWSTAFGYSYGVEASTDLSGGVWSNIITNVPGTGGQVTVTNAISSDAEFYKAYQE